MTTFRARLRDALENEPHLSVDDVVTTVERLLAEHGPAPAPGPDPAPRRPPQGHTGLRDRIDKALRTVGLARNLAAYRDAVLPVVEEALTEQHDRAVLAEATLRDHGAKLAAEMRYGQQQYDRAEETERQRDEALAALREFVHDTPCDPHPGNGYCQTHNQQPPCPHEAAKKLLAAQSRLPRCSCDGDPIECSHEAARGEAEAAVERVRALAEADFEVPSRDILAALEPPKETP